MMLFGPLQQAASLAPMVFAIKPGGDFAICLQEHLHKVE